MGLTPFVEIAPRYAALVEIQDRAIECRLRTLDFDRDGLTVS